MPQSLVVGQPSTGDINEPEKGSPEYTRRRIFERPEGWFGIYLKSSSSEAFFHTTSTIRPSNPILKSFSLPTDLVLQHILAIRFFDNFFTVKINCTGGVQRFHDIWECIVGWDLDVVNVEGVERDPLLHASIGIPQLKYVLPQIAQLLSILHGNIIATNIASTEPSTTPTRNTLISFKFLLFPLTREIEKHADYLIQYIILPSNLLNAAAHHSLTCINPSSVLYPRFLWTPVIVISWAVQRHNLLSSSNLTHSTT